MDDTTKFETVYNKKVYINGKEVGGIQVVEPCFDVNIPTVVFNICAYVKRDSVKIDSESIRFDLDFKES